MSKVWPIHRDKMREEEALSLAAQHIKVTCGIDGCKKTFRGLFGTVMVKRDVHRHEEHPDFVPPKPRNQRTPPRRIRELELEPSMPSRPT